MKLAGLLILSCLDMQSASADNTNLPAENRQIAAEEDTQQKKLIKKLNDITIPELTLREALVSDVLQFLSDESKRLDPEKVGVNIVVQRDVVGQQTVTLLLRNVPLIDAIRYATQAAGLNYTIESSAIVVLKEAGVEAAKRAKVEKLTPGAADQDARQKKLVQKLNDITIPELTCREALVSDVLQFLRIESRRLDPEKVGVNIVLQGDTVDAQTVTLSLRDIRLIDAIEYATQAAGLKFRIEPGAIVTWWEAPATGTIHTEDATNNLPPILVIDGITYSNVTFGTVTPSSVTMRHSAGVATIPLSKVPAEVQEHFGYDPQKIEQARQHLEPERRQNAAPSEVETPDSVPKSKPAENEVKITGAFGVALGASLNGINVIGNKRDNYDPDRFYEYQFQFQPSQPSQLIEEYYVWVTVADERSIVDEVIHGLEREEFARAKLGAFPPQVLETLLSLRDMSKREKTEQLQR